MDKMAFRKIAMRGKEGRARKGLRSKESHDPSPRAAEGHPNGSHLAARLNFGAKKFAFAFYPAPLPFQLPHPTPSPHTHLLLGDEAWSG